MAANDVAARRYAQAAFDIARSENAIEQWSQYLSQIAAVMGEEQVSALLSSTRMPLPAKHRLLEQMLVGISPQALNFAKLLVSKGRADLTGQVLEEFRLLADEHKGIAHAVITTAVPLSDDDRSALAKRLGEITGRQVSITTQIDPEIIGGLIAQIGDTLIDGSVRSRLENLRRNLVSG